MRACAPVRGGLYATVPKILDRETVVCLGGGPSLTPADVDYCRHRAFVIAINDAYRLAPWADVLYASDAHWWQWHQGVSSFAGPKYALQLAARRWPGVRVLDNAGVSGLSLNPQALKNGRNSGYQAINLAVLLGAGMIVLLGYDMQRTGGRSHWFGDHPYPVSSPYQAFRGHFASLVGPLADLGIPVINCSRETALEVFPRQRLEETLY